MRIPNRSDEALKTTDSTGPGSWKSKTQPGVALGEKMPDEQAGRDKREETAIVEGPRRIDGDRHIWSSGNG
ncbi:hypothetical protein PgNI_05186 [Pyricularia grisea]|uniref:Uncharacterized protein n=1 Tax=Pyricularia grisea TaxID=148305 RepID=A0A6P8B558_PYRGI|nr:hypothetical protein PgNI_05186 [Pyricularia grisea]TLD10442.1 hypothetical protein PgNI_05186 [Pyricularia grisea]